MFALYRFYRASGENEPGRYFDVLAHGGNEAFEHLKDVLHDRGDEAGEITLTHFFPANWAPMVVNEEEEV